ncbi:hypothetical protein [Bizionia echini]|uniref:hypothetical protein n=1 Tax=Bizionia echini TaxID=649333 RepID=UPI0030DC8265
MKQQLLKFLFLITLGTAFSQNTSRVEVEGKVIANSDVEGVTIFNISSKKGTIANIDGDFTMEVAIKDVLEISALQYEARTVVITQDVIDSKKLRLFLVEAVNTLSEVILLPSKLTGDLLADINNAETQKAILMSFGDLSNMEYGEDEFTKPQNIAADPGVFYNGLNFANIFGINKWLNKPLKKESIQLLRDKRPLDLADIYSPQYINETYGVPVNQVELFFAFCITNGFETSMLGEKNEITRMEFLENQSKLFLKQTNEQN